MQDVAIETMRFEEFCSKFGVAVSITSAPIYLTWRSEQGADARLIQRVVGWQNTGARIRNEQPWTESEDVKRWLRGFHRSAPIGASAQRSDPLYSENVKALAEACLRPSRSQRLATAALILANNTALRPISLARLKWSDVRIRASKGVVEVYPPPYGRWVPRSDEPIVVAKGPPGACLIAALRELKPDRQPGPFVLDGIGGKGDMQRIARSLANIPGSPGQWPRPRLTLDDLGAVIREANRPTPATARDLALMVISHHAALTGMEAIRLNQQSLKGDGRTLSIEVPGRREPVHLWSDPGSPSCPINAWEIWTGWLHEQGQTRNDSPVFRIVSGGCIRITPMTYVALNRTVQTRAEQARLTGDYTFTGLRSGFIRGLLRDGVSELHIASRAGLTSLGAVAHHERRETLMSKSVAGMVGL